MKFILNKIILSALFIVVSTTPAISDTIYFKNGTRLDIEKAWEEDGKIKCIMFGEEYEYEKDTIERIEKQGASVKIKEPYPSQDKRFEFTNERIDEKQQSPSSAKNLSENYHKQALKLTESGQWQEAIEVEKKAYALSPEMDAVRKTLSHCYTMIAGGLFQQGRLNDALINCQRALKYTPDYTPAMEGISHIYVEYAQNAYDRRDFDVAESHLSEAARSFPDNPKAHVLYGKIAYDKDDYNEAKREWLRALDINPNLDEARILLEKFSQEHRVEEKFEEAKTGNFSVKFEGTKKSEIAEAAIRILNDAYVEVGNGLGEYPRHEIPVIIYPRSDIQELDYYPDMAAGLYDGKIRFTEDLFDEQKYFKAVLHHEYTHVIVHIICGRNVPIWLNEGLAEYSAGKFKSAERQAEREKFLQSAAQKKVLIPFRHLSASSLAEFKGLSYPLIALLYAQSDSFVTFIIEKFTVYDVKTILASIGNGESTRKAILETLNYSLEELEKEWQASLLD